jgi:hypothetical protein
MGAKKGVLLLQRAKTSPYGWQRTELDKLYKHYGFIIEAATKHDIVKSLDYPDLRATLTRSSSELHPDYVRHAVDMIEKFLEREKRSKK